jgi:hypothetical protein
MKFLALAVLAGLGALVVSMLPELKRYLKMERM